MVSRTKIPTAIYPIGHTPSNEDGETAGQVMMKSGDGSPVSKQMIQDYPCGDESGHYFISSPLNVYSIGRSGSVVLYVEGGCPNFMWASDNAWATFSSATTSVRYNTIESGADEGQDTVVTVTDANGLKVTINVPWNGAVSCCEDPPAFSIQTIAAELGPFPGESVIFLDGGCSPFTWAISGTGFTLDYAATNSRHNRVHNDATPSDVTITITVEDSCGQTDEISAYYCNCDVEDDVAYDTTNSDETVDQSNTATVIVTGGCTPFSWEVSGTGFTLVAASTAGRTNTLIADGTACGAATITVTDNCEDSCTGYVRCTSVDSEWVLKSSNVCGLSGVGVQIGAVSSFVYFELVSGNKKQLQRRWKVAGHGSDPNCGSAPNTAYCDGQIAYYCPDSPSGNCIDPVDCYPMYCFDPPGNQWGCYCISGLFYYEWECT